jgi:hypothetical protein
MGVNMWHYSAGQRCHEGPRLLARKEPHMAEERLAAGRVGTPESVVRLNLRVAELVKELDPSDLVEVLSGRASWLLNADNENQNQNQGSRAEIG